MKATLPLVLIYFLLLILHHRPENMGENIPKKHTFKKNNNINTSPIHTWLYLYCAYCMHIFVELVLSSDQTVKVILKIQIF